MMVHPDVDGYTKTLNQWCSNRGPRSIFHWKENL